MQTLDQLRKLISSCLTDMSLIDNQDELHLLIDIQQSLNEERVRYLVLLTFVIFEPWAVIKGHVFNNNLGRD